MDKVIFRKFKDGQIIALFPEIFDSYKYNHGVLCSSYMHVGQHSGADYDTVCSNTKLAKPEEYADLKRELESLGYSLEVVSTNSIGSQKILMQQYYDYMKELGN